MRYKLIIGLVGCLVIAGKGVEGKDIYVWNSTATPPKWEEYKGVTTATGAGSSTALTTYFSVTANVQDLLTVEFNHTSLSWMIKEPPPQGERFCARLTHGKVEPFATGAGVLMTVKGMDALESGNKTIDVYYEFVPGNETEPQTDPSDEEPAGNGTAGWHNATAIDEGTRTFYTGSGGSYNYTDATWITDTNGFDIWCALNITNQTFAGYYSDSFSITLSIEE